ncbi:MAG: TIGR02757 family protein [Thermodesulfovibrio sp.]
MQKIKEKLENLYNSFDFEKAVQNDPIKFPKRFTDPLDIEISAIIASFFAYGNIKCFCNFLEELFRIMERNPSEFILTFKPLKLIEKLNIKYRFSSTHDIVAFLFILKNMLKNSPSGSLEHYFQCHSKQSEEFPSLILKILNFTKSAIKIDLTPIYGKNIKPQGLLHFFPNPLKGSPCKRINLFLRWMVRNKDIDFGLWNTIKPKDLIIPLDIHIWKVSKKLGFTRKNTQSIKTAIEITEYLRKIEPEDPLKYDFVLCHGDINSLI